MSLTHGLTGARYDLPAAIHGSSPAREHHVIRILRWTSSPRRAREDANDGWCTDDKLGTGNRKHGPHGLTLAGRQKQTRSTSRRSITMAKTRTENFDSKGRSSLFCHPSEANVPSERRRPTWQDKRTQQHDGIHGAMADGFSSKLTPVIDRDPASPAPVTRPSFFSPPLKSCTPAREHLLFCLCPPYCSQCPRPGLQTEARHSLAFRLSTGLPYLIHPQAMVLKP